MDLSNLKPAKGSIKSRKRLGRGQGSGRGGTATRGHKGQQSRSGYSRKKGHEGGQMPLQRRIPKYGFTNINRKEYKAINISTLEEIANKKKIDSFDINTFIEAGLISGNSQVKILGNGTLTLKLSVKAHAFSNKAKEIIESLGGTTEIV